MVGISMIPFFGAVVSFYALTIWAAPRMLFAICLAIGWLMSTYDLTIGAPPLSDPK